MRLDEVKNYYQNLSDEDLRQKLNEDNTTDVSADDLVKVVRTHQLNEWHNIDIDDHLIQIESMIKQVKKKSLKIVESKGKNSTPPSQSGSPIFKISNLYLDTLKDYSDDEEVLAALKGFLESKKNNPLEPYGKNDRLFSGDGFLRHAVSGESMAHARLAGRDSNIFYTLQGKPPTFKLYGIFNHRDSGTGTPPNLKKQKTISKQLGNAGNWQDLKT